MGNATSSNAASAVTEVSNFVSNSTNTNSLANTTTDHLTTFYNCLVKARDINIKNTNKTVSKATQLAATHQNANITNNIAQKMLQTASSTVGSAGIGYADASNSASEFANSSNVIQQALSNTSTQLAYNHDHFSCNNSTFIASGDFTISNDTDTNFFADLTSKNDQVVKLENDISQSITQKATAKVAGLVGFLLALAVVIVALGWSFAKVGTSIGFKTIIIVVLVIVITGVLITLYIYKAPPLFNDSPSCSPANLAIGGCVQGGTCINLKQKSLNLKQPPMRYVFPLYSIGDSPSLLNMAIVRAGSVGKTIGMNGGINQKAYNTLQDFIVNNVSTWAQKIVDHYNTSDKYITIDLLTFRNPIYHPVKDSTNTIINEER